MGQDEAVPAGVVPAATAAATPGDGLVTLYDDEGYPVRVPADRVEHHLGRGYRRTRFDPEDALSDLLARLEAAPDVIRRFADSARGGKIHPGEDRETAVAQRHMGDLAAAWVALFAGLTAGATVEQPAESSHPDTLERDDAGRQVRTVYQHPQEQIDAREAELAKLRPDQVSRESSVTGQVPGQPTEEQRQGVAALRDAIDAVQAEKGAGQ